MQFPHRARNVAVMMMRKNEEEETYEKEGIMGIRRRKQRNHLLPYDTDKK